MTTNSTAPRIATEHDTTTVPQSLIAVMVIFFVALVLSAIRPHDYFTWFLEVVPALIAFVVLAATYRRFRFTTLVYAFICVHCIVLMAGGHWTYARVPLGEWMKPLLNTQRNDYDRIGHFMQGFVPALIAREVFIRRRVVRGRKWLFFIVTGVCLGISAFYEFFEYGVAVATGTKADDFLGSQGDPWDTQNDMLTAFVGAILAQLTLGAWHNRAIRRLAPETVSEAEQAK